MLNNIIRNEDKIYVIHRKLSSSTSEETAININRILGTDTLLRDAHGNWFCCNVAKEVEFRDIETIIDDSSDVQNYDHTQFELGDNGGLG
jgi:hypothetical protein